jgi:uncharacterized protein with von Willebrand factor type A (vWA) domain
MEERIIRFISALRAGGVRVSLAESVDAMLAIDQLGVKDRGFFRHCLRSTLVKNASDLPVFEELFPLFFDTTTAPLPLNISEELTPDEAHSIAKALRQFKQELREMLERLLRGEQLSQNELDQLGKIIGLSQANDLRSRSGWPTNGKSIKVPRGTGSHPGVDGFTCGNGNKPGTDRLVGAFDAG